VRQKRYRSGLEKVRKSRRGQRECIIAALDAHGRSAWENGQRVGMTRRRSAKDEKLGYCPKFARQLLSLHFGTRSERQRSVPWRLRSLPKFPFFHIVWRTSRHRMLKNQYCLGDNTGCARHQVKVALGSDLVPSDLLPAQTEKVKGILAAHRK
jgi:hypothetical protein